MDFKYFLKKTPEKVLAATAVFFISALVLSFAIWDKSVALDKESLSSVFRRGGTVDVDLIGAEDGLNQEEEEAIEEEIIHDLTELEIKDGEENDDVEYEDELTEAEMKDGPPAGPDGDGGALPAGNTIFRADKDELRIGFVTDIHARSSTSGKSFVLKPVYQERLAQFVNKLNSGFNPDMVVVNGDVIEGTRTPNQRGTAELRLVQKALDGIKAEKYWVLGNHELRSVTKSQWKTALGISYLHKSFEVKGYKIIILDSNFTKDGTDAGPGNGHTRGKVSEKQLEWLKKELENTKKRTIVFIHHPPLWNVDIKDNNGLPDNSSDLRAIFSEYGVLAVFAGHIEDLYHEKVDGVDYFVFPGLVKNKTYEGAFAEISAKDKRVRIDFTYLDEDTGKYVTVRIGK